ncbi:MAG: hypothetical protein V1717_00540 [Candidatus Micrarchaeota archaeon]
MKTLRDRRKGVVFSIDAVFATIMAAVAVTALASFFYRAPSTLALQELALDELTVFDKSGVFKSIASCPSNRDSVVQNFLSNSVPKATSYAFAVINVTIYESTSFTLKCTASGSYGTPTGTLVSSKRLFFLPTSNNQYFGIAEIKVGG